MVELVDDTPICPVCLTPCNKSLGAHQQTVNRFWGGSHGEKVFYTKETTIYYCSEDCRTYDFFGDGTTGRAF